MPFLINDSEIEEIDVSAEHTYAAWLEHDVEYSNVADVVPEGCLTTFSTAGSTACRLLLMEEIKILMLVSE